MLVNHSLQIYFYFGRTQLNLSLFQKLYNLLFYQLTRLSRTLSQTYVNPYSRLVYQSFPYGKMMDGLHFFTILSKLGILSNIPHYMGRHITSRPTTKINCKKGLLSIISLNFSISFRCFSVVLFVYLNLQESLR